MIDLKYLKTTRRTTTLIVAFLFFLLISLVFLLWVRGQVRQYIYNDIDRQLLVVAETIGLILPEDYHLRAKTPDSISSSEYKAIEKKLTALAEKSGAKYVWTDILIDGSVYLTTCNSTPGPGIPEADIYYFMPYKDGVSEAQMRAFASEEPVYTTFQDIWGSFRAVFVPIKNPDGSVYLACAEFTVDYVDIMVSKSNVLFGLGLLAFIIGISPLCYLYILGSRDNRRLLERKNLQLHQSRENLHTTLNSIGDAVIVTDAEGIIRNMNPVAEKLSGWKLADAQGRPHEKILQFVSTEESLQVPSKVNHVLASKKVIQADRNITLIAKDNKRVEISDSAAPIMAAGSDDIVGVVLIIRDVTEWNRMEEDRRQSQKLESLGQLAGGIAHDFNNMLAGISGASEMLAVTVADNPVAMKYVDLIKNATERTADLTRKLLAFSRKEKVVFNQVNVHAIIQDAVDILERSIDKRIIITKEFKAEEFTIFGDASQLQNAFLNMFINARDAMPGGGELHITTVNTPFDESCCTHRTGCEDDQYIRILIRDTGQGISPDILPHIFEPFYTTKGVGKGTGLGLAAVYGMIKDHKGMIGVKSAPDQGTILNICLPLTSLAPAIGTYQDNEEEHGNSTILLIDDEDVVRKTNELMLEDMGYTVICAEDGVKGLSEYKKRAEEIDLIILDMVMPVMDGKQVFEEIRAFNPDAKVIISSGFTSGADINELREKGLAGFIMKPYNRLQLGKLLSEVNKGGKAYP